jgi:hypothetical protein
VTGDTFAAVREPVDELYIYNVATVVIKLAFAVNGPVAIIFAFDDVDLVADIDTLDIPFIVTVSAGVSAGIAYESLIGIKSNDRIANIAKYFCLLFT